MNWREVFSLVCTGMLSAVLGCGPAAAPPADPEKARHALTASLDAWKSGATPDVLQQQSPPIYCRDPDWKAGWKLESYRATQDDETFGRQRRSHLQLKLKSPEGKSAAKDVQYSIDTSSTAVVIIRLED